MPTPPPSGSPSYKHWSLSSGRPGHVRAEGPCRQTGEQRQRRGPLPSPLTSADGGTRALDAGREASSVGEAEQVDGPPPLACSCTRGDCGTEGDDSGPRHAAAAQHGQEMHSPGPDRWA
mmetsp:Transcript_142986/g.456916  ORF Transcript_142986/g.456916 Transcript_142986/m.456916 type:complete len:119 (+) Transcript_142986:1184-1540(+)